MKEEKHYDWKEQHGKGRWVAQKDCLERGTLQRQFRLYIPFLGIK
jgi:hypothetical protein